MEIEGQYSSGVVDFIDCRIIIKGGYLIPYNTTSANHYNKYIQSPKDTNLISIKPTYSKKAIAKPDNKHNYIINYIGEDNEEHLIFIKSNKLKNCIIKWNLRRCILHSETFKSGLYAAIIVFGLSQIPEMVKNRKSHANNSSTKTHLTVPVPPTAARSNYNDSTLKKNNLKTNSKNISLKNDTIN